MKPQVNNAQLITRLLFRQLPFQILLAVVGQVNGIISSIFASNYVGIQAMSAIGLYGPINTLLAAMIAVMVGGSAIVSGRYMGQNEEEKLQSVFSLDLVLSFLIGAVMAAVQVVFSLCDWTGFLCTDPAVRPFFNQYLLGQAIGVLPFILGNQLPGFLLMENRGNRTMAASLIYIAFNLLLNYLFVQVLHLEAFGLALASSLGMWVFFLVELQYFLSGKSHLRLSLRGIRWKESLEIIRTGIPGALASGYMTLRGFIVNGLITTYAGSAGISAFAAANNLLGLFWAIPNGMLAVSRIMISVSVGEEDRKTLTDIMRVMFRRFVPLMLLISAALALLAGPLTRVFFQNPAEPVFMMTVWGFRILPLCMPLAIIVTHFVCYGQASKKIVFVNVESLLDGFLCVAGFSALLAPRMGLNGVYLANVLNGVVCVLFIFIYSWIRRRKPPKNMAELMVIPDDFGVADKERMNLTVRTMDEVVSVSEQIQAFCLSRGVSPRKAMLSGLSMEEMAGNIIRHGFSGDSKNHFIDIRVVHKGEDVFLRIRDDCAPFNPRERAELLRQEDRLTNIGIRMVFSIARDMQYQNILGLNVLTISI